MELKNNTEYKVRPKNIVADLIMKLLYVSVRSTHQRSTRGGGGESVTERVA